MPFVQIGDYPIDVFTKEVHAYESEITQYAIEIGSDVTDNVRTLPNKVTVDAVVSDTPTGAIAKDPTRTGVGQISISQDAHNRLLKMRDDKLPISVVTSLGTYTSMMITKYEVTRDAKSFKGLVFTCEFEKATIVENKRVTVAVPNVAGKGSLGNSDSDTFRRTSLFATQTLAVVTFTKPSPGLTKIYGKPIATDGYVALVDGVTPVNKFPDKTGFHYAIEGTATNNPDGYIKNANHLNGADGQVYEALKPPSIKSTNQLVQDTVSELRSRKDALDFANSHGQHYDPQSGQWKDVNGNPVTHDPNAVENFKNRVRDSPPKTLQGAK